MKNKPAAAGCPDTMGLSFVFCGIFLLRLWKKRRFLVGVSCYKKVTLDKLCFFLFRWNYSFFSKSHRFFYFFISEYFSARKCSLCQTRHVPTESPINKNFCYCRTTYSQRKSAMPDSGFVFRIHKFSETSKGPLQFIITGVKVFRQLSAMPLPCFVQK